MGAIKNLHTDYVSQLFKALDAMENARDLLSETSKTRKRIDEVIYILVDMLEASGALDE